DGGCVASASRRGISRGGRPRPSSGRCGRDRPPIPRPSHRQAAMSDGRLVAGLDLGSATTTAVIAEVVGELARAPGIRILGTGHARTTGLRRGVVADIEETTRSIRTAL